MMESGTAKAFRPGCSFLVPSLRLRLAPFLRFMVYICVHAGVRLQI